MLSHRWRCGPLAILMALMWVLGRPSQPYKFLMPLKEPIDSVVAPKGHE